MEEKIKVSPDTKEPVIKKAETVIEKTKEKVETKTDELVKKVKETELAEKAKEKLGDIKEGAKKLWDKAADKLSRPGDKQIVKEEKK